MVDPHKAHLFFKPIQKQRYAEICSTRWLQMEIVFVVLYLVIHKLTGWWYTYPSKKYDFVRWDDDIPNIWNNKSHVWNHQQVLNLDIKALTIQTMGNTIWKCHSDVEKTFKKAVLWRHVLRGGARLRCLSRDLMRRLLPCRPDSWEDGCGEHYPLVNIQNIT